ncbi:MAG: hypothetical protein V4598_12730 [Bdellovibrionota bacterium]
MAETSGRKAEASAESSDVLEVPYPESRAANPGHRTILTRGLNPCIPLLLTGISSDGKKLACLSHVPAPPMDQSREWHQPYLENHFNDCKSQLEAQGLNPSTLRAMTHARFQGDPDYLKNTTPQARNDASLQFFLNQKKETGVLSEVKSVINDGAEYRTFFYDIQTGAYRITSDADTQTVLTSGEF